MYCSVRSLCISLNARLQNAKSVTAFDYCASRYNFRLQNGPYFAYSSTREQSNKKSGARLQTESETGERR